MDYRQHRLDYCQFLISSQINYTQTYLADHSEHYSHDSMNRFLRLDTLTPRTLWENVRDDVVVSSGGTCCSMTWYSINATAKKRG